MHKLRGIIKIIRKYVEQGFKVLAKVWIKEEINTQFRKRSKLHIFLDVRLFIIGFKLGTNT